MRKFQIMDWRGYTYSEYCPDYPYEKFLDAQNYVWKQRLLGLIPDTLILAYHPPTITLGSRSLKEQLSHIRPLLKEWLQEEDEEEFFTKAGVFLRSQYGINLVKTTRGGSVWYHDQGVLQLYIITKLDSPFPAMFVWSLEEALYQTLALFLPVERPTERIQHKFQSLIGVWTSGKKIGAIGVRVEKNGPNYISKFGASVNIDPDLQKLALIDPCGLTDKEATSLCHELSKTRRVFLEQDFLSAFYEKFSEIFDAGFPKTIHN